MTVNKLTSSIKPLDEVDKINEIIDELGNVTTDLANLNDVSVSNPANNQALLYNSTSSKWENKNGFDLGNVSATVTNTVGTPSCTVTKGGTYSATTLAFAFENIKGATGDTGSSGVYVGSTAPTDPDINVWIDTSGTATTYATDLAFSSDSLQLKDASNNTIGTAVNFSYAHTSADNFTDAGKIALVHLVMPSTVYENVSLTTSGHTYTAPADGYYCLNCGANANTDYFTITNNTNGMVVGSGTSANGNYLAPVIMPVNANDEIEVVHTFSDYTRVSFFRFYYANGTSSLHVSS